ncbi:hypothetical protein [Leptospira licerasiae]|uniref:Twin-arginine translocation signal domain-containing protein n=1 Tax=Leptospira licerasiae str. MMD4847 TaxID=1049971 RepID=A0ABN0HC17_9LEPT|nr:hypothetical protein [Leptospira licerasiae]EIE02445.1 hypothetical protein LEP1GSC185_1273 [Leptospira licerasiae serovar Varillal str. VAR 010]EJZ43302.1 hypothetical protein LEP1GSC178_3267 [Leptospira licerasiae str. MMD4847]TGM90590.1 hypothetical protein EHR05_07300 [Leptospira licerasiae]
MESFLDEKVSRSRFLKFLLKTAAVSAILVPQASCKSGPIPKLHGLSDSEYLAFKSLEEVFLVGNPIQGFDLGVAADKYIYGHPYPIDTESVLKLLAFLPGSSLVSLALDFSFTSMVGLSKEDREKRLLSWKNSSLSLKRGAYNIMRQLSFFLVSMERDYNELVGYKG